MRGPKFFDPLHALITLHTQIPGIGELYRYDTTLRLAAHLRLHPTRIYLHAGTRTGARNLGLNHKHPSLPRSAFHHLKPLRSLPAHQLEDLLCIYKNQLKKIQLKKNLAKPPHSLPPRTLPIAPTRTPSLSSRLCVFESWR